MEIHFENIEMLLKRNSISNETFYGIVDKMIVYSTGQWGDDESFFLKTGKFVFELDKDEWALFEEQVVFKKRDQMQTETQFEKQSNTSTYSKSGMPSIAQTEVDEKMIVKFKQWNLYAVKNLEHMLKHYNLIEIR